MLPLLCYLWYQYSIIIVLFLWDLDSKCRDKTSHPGPDTEQRWQVVALGFLKAASIGEVEAKNGPHAPAVSALWRSCWGRQSWLGGRKGKEDIWRTWAQAEEACFPKGLD